MTDSRTPRRISAQGCPKQLLALRNLYALPSFSTCHYVGAGVGRKTAICWSQEVILASTDKSARTSSSPMSDCDQHRPEDPSVKSMAFR